MRTPVCIVYVCMLVCMSSSMACFSWQLSANVESIAEHPEMP
jgi:hypothetical protein